MSGKKRIVIFAVMILIIACAQQFLGFAEPTSENTMLVIGQVIVEDKGYTDKPSVYKQDIRVGIYGVGKDESETGVWVRTDENGYFALANVPIGEYAIKALQLTVGAGELTTIENRLSFSDDPYVITNREFFVFNGGYFPYEPVGRIQSLKHNIFTLDLSNRNVLIVRNISVNTLTDYTLDNGEVLNQGPVERYFINKYPNSAWNKDLEESAESNRFKR
jgi:hypothetical protein